MPTHIHRGVVAPIPSASSTTTGKRILPSARSRSFSTAAGSPGLLRYGEGSANFNRRLRRTLFVGLSDGSRIDILQRANARRMSTEQVVPMLNVDHDKWLDLAKKLAEDEGETARFLDVYLVDDFTASGTPFIRRVDGVWKGKLKTFNDIVVRAREELKDRFPIVDGFTLHVHHYISSHQARGKLIERMNHAARDWAEKTYGQHAVTEGLLLPQKAKLENPADAAMLDLCERYYDHGLFKRLEKHCKQARQKDMKRGYAECALPVVLDHNTPNNSVSLLWAETDGSEGPSMTPLFPRRDRHG